MRDEQLTVVILTFNEELHIERAIKSVSSIASRVLVVDSGSTDRTKEKSEALGAEVRFNKFVNHAVQMNWALDNCDIATPWVLRLDADEYLTDELIDELPSALKQNKVTHFSIKRRVFFMGRWIKHGGYYPVWLLRLWRHGDNVRCESRWMDEHIKVDGGAGAALKNDLVDQNLNGLTWWTEKHNRYATREAVDILNTIYSFSSGDQVTPKFFGNQTERKRWLKMRYVRLPLFVRPALYFVYRYIIKLGFLDGKAGLIWHCLQGGWYRFLVDAKIAELYHRVGKEPEAVLKHINDEWGIELVKK